MAGPSDLLDRDCDEFELAKGCAALSLIDEIQCVNAVRDVASSPVRAPLVTEANVNGSEYGPIPGSLDEDFAGAEIGRAHV